MLPVFLAEFTPIDEAFQVNVYSVLVLAGALVALWVAFRRKPPLDSHLAKLESAIDGLQKSVDALTHEQKRYAPHATKITELESKVRLLEGHRETDAASQRSYLAKNTREIFERIESEGRITQDKMDAFTANTQESISALSTTLSQNLQSIERGIGRFDGALDLIRDRLNQMAK